MQAAGAGRIVALVKEDIGTEVQDFREFWGGEVLLDAKMEFYKALGGGSYHKPYNLCSFIGTLLNPFGGARMKTNLQAMKDADIKQNFTGEGFIHGGVYVLAKDGTVAHSFLEDEIADRAPIEPIINALAFASKT